MTLLGKLKENNDDVVYRILGSKENIYNNPKFDKVFDYKESQNYKLEDDEWFKIDKYSEQTKDPIIILLKNDGSCADIALIKRDKYQDIEYFICEQDSLFIFEKLPKYRAAKKKFLSLKGELELEPELISSKDTIIFGSRIDAVYNPVEDTLYFKKPEINILGIDSFYKEATEKDIKRFVEKIAKPLNIEFKDNYKLINTGVNNKKAIVRVNEKLGELEPKTLDHFKQKFTEYVKEYKGKAGINVNNGKVTIGSDKELKYTLAAIEGKYHKRFDDDEKMYANSVRKLG